MGRMGGSSSNMKTKPVIAMLSPISDRSPLSKIHVSAASDSAKFLASALLAVYFFRASLLSTVLKNTVAEFFYASSIIALLVAGSYVSLCGHCRIQWLRIGIFVAAGVSLIGCEQVGIALPRWLGWIILVVTVGPVISGIHARVFRDTLYRYVSLVIVCATMLSALWWLVRLPNLGRGDFTGVMAHSMLLGPIAALCGLLALSRALSGRSPVWYAVFIIAVGVGLLAS